MNPVPTSRSPHTPLLLLIAGTLLMLLGLAVGAIGAWLIALGDTWYYLVAGAAFAVSGVLLLR